MLGMNLHSVSSAVMRSVFYFLLVSSLLFITHGARYQFVGHHDEQQVHTIAFVVEILHNYKQKLKSMH